MYLQINKLSDDIISIQRNVESMGNRFLLINLDFEIQIDSQTFEHSYYWRLDSQKDSPPLEIGINKSKGLAKSITFFISNDEFISDDLEVTFENKIGLPYFETNFFKEGQFYIDNIGEYRVYHKNNSLLCLFNKMMSSYRISLNEFFDFLLSKDNELMGFSINKLNKDELEQLTKSNFIYN